MGLDEEASLVQRYVAETLKYLYLVFANPEGINPKECVFSTEAHPFYIN